LSRSDFGARVRTVECNESIEGTLNGLREVRRFDNAIGKLDEEI